MKISTVDDLANSPRKSPKNVSNCEWIRHKGIVLVGNNILFYNNIMHKQMYTKSAEVGVNVTESLI